MRLLAAVITLGMSVCMAQEIVVPAGTKVVVALIGAVPSRSARTGDTVNCQSTFPVAVDGKMAIPPGTYVKGLIDILIRPTVFSGRAEFRMHFTRIMFANGYTVALPGPEKPGAIAAVTAVVSSRSDVLLDNGTQFEMVLEQPLSLDSSRITAAVARSRAPATGEWKSATQCRPVPATPGTHDIYIPGTPGTPSTTIPGGPGQPDILIPGTPGTPATVIPGSSGTPEIPCPPAPVIRSEPVAHHEAFSIATPVLAGGEQLRPGNYEAAWKGLGPRVQVSILRRGKPVANVPATLVPAGPSSPGGKPVLRNNADRSWSLQLVRFPGRTYALRFE